MTQLGNSTDGVQGWVTGKIACDGAMSLDFSVARRWNRFSMSPVFAQAPGRCGVPVARDDAWPVAAIDDGKLIDRGALCETTDRLAASSAANVHAVLVARGGKLVFERYFRGADEVPGRIYSRRVENVTFDAATLHDMKSVSKSVASLAVGIAIDQGLIGSVNEPIFGFFPELSDLRTPEKERIQSYCTRSPCRWV